MTSNRVGGKEKSYDSGLREEKPDKKTGKAQGRKWSWWSNVWGKVARFFSSLNPFKKKQGYEAKVVTPIRPGTVSVTLPGSGNGEADKTDKKGTSILQETPWKQAHFEAESAPSEITEETREPLDNAEAEEESGGQPDFKSLLGAEADRIRLEEEGKRQARGEGKTTPLEGERQPEDRGQQRVNLNIDLDEERARLEAEERREARGNFGNDAEKP